MLRSFIPIIFSFLAISCNKSKNLPTVSKLSLEKYAGKWYEIARLPNRFEKGLTCVSATYSIKENGKIEVINRGQIIETKESKEITGTATVPNSEYPGRLKVSFFWPFSGNYYVISLADDYSYALVGDPSRKYLWILSKTKTLKQDVYDNLVKIAEINGFTVQNLVKINQDCS